MNRLKTIAVAGVTLGTISGCGTAVEPALPCDSAVEKRIEAILGKMTLEEKIGQMTQLTIGVIMDEEREQLVPELMDTVFGKYKVGSILNVIGNSAPRKEKYVRIISEIQEKSLKEIGIPCLYGLDQIHGASYIAGATLFPQEINLAATFSRGYAEDMGRVTAYETRAALVPWTFSPVMDLGREPLWPRMWESFGEDTYLNAELAKAMVHGLQGDDPGNVDGNHIAACIKHYMAYGVPVSGQDRTPSKVSDAELREKYFEPFKQCIRNGALSLMVNSSSNNGVPFHANHKLLTVWLKENLAWDGLIVTDWNDINNLYYRDRIATSEKDAVRLAINAGIDMAMVPSTWKFCIDLKELVEDGAVGMDRIDDAVRRVLRLKMRLGLFENPVWDTDWNTDFACEAFSSNALAAALESEVLLKNNGVLPLKGTERILVCGPNANSMRCLNGGWSYTWQGDASDAHSKDYNTIYEALSGRFPGQVTWCPGLEYAPEKGDNWYEEGEPDFKTLLRAASGADVIVACVGERSYCETPGNWKDLNLSANQQELVRVLSRTGKPVVLAYSGGRPRVIREIEPLSDAVVALMLPGNYGGDAFASLVAGDVNFSGKLPFTWPKYTAGYAPYDYKVSENVATMEGEYNYDAKMDSQWQFGEGLSYTSFEYSSLCCDRTEFSSDDVLTFTVDVKNVGNRAGKEAVLLFTSDMYASEVPDVRRLRAFDKVAVEPGQTQKVTLSVKASDLAFVGQDGRWRLEKGDFRVACGPLSLIVRCTEDRIWEEPDIL
ncbi:MAG: glycoside hydrolase family 3 N-terminal domain-containing protein [Bacteroidales bacterium]|nr:glycoside hydrolase family 3 N-terminal domain-containing protein [Bacteroidales bacterium]